MKDCIRNNGGGKVFGTWDDWGDVYATRDKMLVALGVELHNYELNVKSGYLLGNGWPENGRREVPGGAPP